MENVEIDSWNGDVGVWNVGDLEMKAFEDEREEEMHV
jgi:hypothetical protein